MFSNNSFNEFSMFSDSNNNMELTKFEADQDQDFFDVFANNKVQFEFPSFEIYEEKNVDMDSASILPDQLSSGYDGHKADELTHKSQESDQEASKSTEMGQQTVSLDLYRDSKVESGKPISNNLQSTVADSESKPTQVTSEADRDIMEQLNLRILDPIKYTRWGKIDDRRLYKQLRLLENDGQATLESWLKDSTLPCDELITSLSYKVSWRGTDELMIKRIRKMLKPSKLSVREKKYLHQIIIDLDKQSEIDVNEVSYNFPGKDLDYLRVEINKVQAEIEEW